MPDTPSTSGQPPVPPVDPILLGSAAFLFQEYLDQLAADNPGADEDAAPPEIETKAVLTLFAEELGTNVQTTLNLYLRITALYRLLAQSPALTALAMDDEQPGGALTENALVAAARLELKVTRKGAEGAAEFDPRAFREALLAD